MMRILPLSPIVGQEMKVRFRRFEMAAISLLRHTTVVSDIPVLAAYQARCEARPAFKRALAAQLAPFERYAPVAA
jgi:glutathione S-transferase